jgi:anthranilate synthase/aminodeoxychorismate synthase-like glutamine amidotransferase
MTEKHKGNPLNILFIDNFDSFVFNLVDEFALRSCNVEVWRNDIKAEKALELVANMASPRLVVLSPGPGTPAKAGCCLELVQRAPEGLPILGICLGYQSIVEAFGGVVSQAGEIVHGKASLVEHVGTDLFEGLPSPMTVGRYHSLMATDVPDELKITASLRDMPMAVQHARRKVAGMQFHPESILTPQGGLLVDNVFKWASKTVGS